MGADRRMHSVDQFVGVRTRLGRLVQEIAAGLDALHRVQFDEPWKQDKRRRIYGEW